MRRGTATQRRRPDGAVASIKDSGRKGGRSPRSHRVMNDRENVGKETRERGWRRALAALRAAQRRAQPDHPAYRRHRRPLADLFGEFFSEFIRGIDAGARSARPAAPAVERARRGVEVAAAIRTMRGRVDGLLVMSPHVEARSGATVPATLPLAWSTAAFRRAHRPQPSQA